MENSEDRKLNILVATLGSSAGVITQTLNALLFHYGKVDRVIVVHTGENKVQKALSELINEWSEDRCHYKLFHNARFFKNGEMCQAEIKRILDRLKASSEGDDYGDYVHEENGKIYLKVKLETRPVEFREKDRDCHSHHCAFDRGGPVRDITCRCCSNAFQDELYEAIPYDDRHQVALSLAGGRKTMSGAAAIAAQNIGVGLLCHVLEPVGWGLEDCRQPPLDSYEFTELPFADVAGLVRLAIKNTTKKGDENSGSDFQPTSDDYARSLRENLNALKRYPEKIGLVAGLSAVHELQHIPEALLSRMKRSATENPEDLQNLIKVLKRFIGLSNKINTMVYKNHYPRRRASGTKRIYKEDEWKRFLDDLRDIAAAKAGKMDRVIDVTTSPTDLDLFKVPFEIDLDVLCFSLRVFFTNSLLLIENGGTFNIAYDDQNHRLLIADSGPKKMETEGMGIGMELVRFVLLEYDVTLSDLLPVEGDDQGKFLEMTIPLCQEEIEGATRK